MSEDCTSFTVQPATIDQMAGTVALTLGALGSLLLVIWQSRCQRLCRCRIGISDKSSASCLIAKGNQPR